MKKTVTNVLSLTAEEALGYFMKTSQYQGFELPGYFDFDKVLVHVREAVGDKSYEDCLSGVMPDNLDNVNLDIVLNKDGRYAIRPLMLVNPFLYYFLVRELCNADAWKAVNGCFEAYKVPRLTSCAMPVVLKEGQKEPFYKSATILNWWHTMEQRSIELSLQYRYMFVTDITNCYGSIIPQSIEWALTCKDTCHENNGNRGLAANIQKLIRAMQHGHNIGIPQGSALFDFVGEIVLGYADLLLHEALKEDGITDGYEIIRYRDDYRVFSNNKDILERISYHLQAVLVKLHFNMNPQKTRMSDSIVLDSVKPDKLFYVYNTPIFGKDSYDFSSFEKHLLYILMYGRQFPNSGQLKTLLSNLDKRVEEWMYKPYGKVIAISDAGEETFRKIEEDDDEEQVSTDGRRIHRHWLPGGSIRALVAIATQIAIDNVAVVHYALRLVSRMLEMLKDDGERRQIAQMVYDKLCRQRNSDYNQLWLQNITYANDVANGSHPYTMRLCRVVMGDKDVELWNNSWLKPELSEGLPTDTVVVREALPKESSVITFRERLLYSELMELMSIDYSEPLPTEEELKNMPVMLVL